MRLEFQDKYKNLAVLKVYTKEQMIDFDYDRKDILQVEYLGDGMFAVEVWFKY